MKNPFQFVSATKLIRSRRLWLSGACAALIAGCGIFAANLVCQRAARGLIYRSLADVPQNDVALVLGTSKKTAFGHANFHFDQRINAAAALYHSGKVRHLLVSGDNHIASYDEPDDMRDALLAAGVPADAITCDYAGFRTLDSVVRAQQVFGLSRCTIVTEEFHCPRALWIARQHGLDAVAFAAPDVSSLRWSLRVRAREVFARAWCGIDLYVLHRQPHFTGPREPIQLGAAKNPLNLKRKAPITIGHNSHRSVAATVTG
jgi:SanA protein